MNDVIIYTTATCPYCYKAITLLKKKGVPFTNIDVTFNKEKKQEVQNLTGWNTVPQIFIAGEFIGGCDDMHRLDADGKLDALLGV